jgi:hypothetical protein
MITDSNAEEIKKSSLPAGEGQWLGQSEWHWPDHNALAPQRSRHET